MCSCAETPSHLERATDDCTRNVSGPRVRWRVLPSRGSDNAARCWNSRIAAAIRVDPENEVLLRPAAIRLNLAYCVHPVIPLGRVIRTAIGPGVPSRPTQQIDYVAIRILPAPFPESLEKHTHSLESFFFG